MRIKLTCRNRLAGYSNTSEIDVSMSDNMLDICTKAGVFQRPITFYEYYQEKFIMSELECVPYIIRNKKYVWNVPYSDVTLSEFIQTNEVDINNGIVFEGGEVGGMSPEFVQNIINSWIAFLNNIWPLIKTFFEIAGGITSTYGIWTCIRGRLFKEAKDDSIPPVDTYIQRVYSHKYWDAQEFKELFDVDNTVDVKRILDFCGYDYDKTTKIYTRNDDKRDELWELLFLIDSDRN